MKLKGGPTQDEVLAISLMKLGLRNGDVFADIGCGDGFFTSLAAKKVGENGKVYAVDVDAQAIEKLQAKAAEQKLTNISTKVSKAEDTVFCHHCIDMVFYSMDLHDFGDASKVLDNAWHMIKPEGRLIDLDWKKQQMPMGPPLQIRFSEEQACGLIRAAGFTVIDLRDAGPYHYVVTAKPT